MAETVRQFFFCQEKEWFRQNFLRAHKHEPAFAALYISKRKSLSIAVVNLFEKFSSIWLFTVRGSNEQLHSKPAYYGETVWLFFSSTKKMASPKRSLLTQIRIDICRTPYPPNGNPYAKLQLIRSKMLISFDHKQYVEADKDNERNFAK